MDGTRYVTPRTLSPRVIGGESQAPSAGPASGPASDNDVRALHMRVYKETARRHVEALERYRGRRLDPNDTTTRNQIHRRAEEAADRFVMQRGLPSVQEIAERDNALDTARSHAASSNAVERGVQIASGRAIQTTAKIAEHIGESVVGEDSRQMGNHRRLMSAIDAHRHAAESESGVVNNLIGHTLGTVGDPVWMTTYGVGRSALAGSAGRGGRGRLMDELIAGAGADAIATMVRTEGDLQETKEEVGYGVAGAVGGEMLIRGIGRAWRKAFPNKALPASAAEAQRLLDAEAPSWRQQQAETLGGIQAATRELSDAVDSDIRAREIIPDGVGQRVALPERGAPTGLDRFEARQAARDAKLQEGLDAPRVERDAALRQPVDRLETQNRGGQVLDDPASHADPRSEALKDPEVVDEIEALESLGMTREQAESVAIPTMQLNSGIPLDTIVEEAVKLGKWAKPHAIAAARWAYQSAGDAIQSMRDFTRVVMERFGRAIRKHVPAMWENYKAFMRRVNTSQRRAMGGVDWRSRVSKTDQKAIEGGARKAIRQQVAQDRAVRDEVRKQAIEVVKDAFPARDANRGRFLHAVRTATTDQRLQQVVERVEKLKAADEAKIAERQDIKETLQFAGRILKKKVGGDVRVSAAMRNSQWADRVQEIRDMGIRNPARPSRKEVAKLSSDQRTDLLAKYNKLARDFQAERQALSSAKEIKGQAEAIVREVSESRRRELKARTGSARQPDVGLLHRVVRDGWLNMETATGLIGQASRDAIYEPVRRARTSQLAQYRDWSSDLVDALHAGGIIKDKSTRGLRKWINSVSGSLANRNAIKVPMGGETIEMSRAQWWELLAHMGDRETLQLLLDGAPLRLKNHARPVALKFEDVDHILSMASKEDLAVVAAFRKVFSTNDNSMKHALNEFKRKATGMDDFAKSDDYFPRTRDAGSEVENIEELMLFDSPGKMESRPMMKARTKDTTKPIVSGDIFSTFDRHAAQVAAITKMSDGVSRARGVLNNPKVREEVRARHGESMLNAIGQWMDDTVQDAARFGKYHRAEDGLLSKAIHNVGIGVLGFNPFTVAKQVPSLLGATLEIEGRYLAKGAKEAANPLSKQGQAVRARMRKHNANIWARYEMHTSRLVGDMTSDPAIVTRSRGMMESAMLGISAADESVIASIWRAAELKMTDKGLRGDAYWHAVSEEADRVIRRTQPNFDAVNSSSMQRGGRNEPFKKAVSMFMSQRNVYFNLMYDAMASRDPKKIARVLAIIAVANPLMIAAVDESRDGMYGRNEGHDAGELAKDMGVNALSNTLSYAYFGDWASYAARGLFEDRAFEPSSPVSGQVNDMVVGTRQIKAGEVGGGLKRIALAGSTLAGVPIRTPWRIGEELIEAMSGDGGGDSSARPDRPSRPTRPTRPSRPSRP